jgi:monoamine oxidase
MIYDYIIIGGGIAGLYTTYHLSKKNPTKKILLIERDTYLGGRVHTYSDKYMTVEAGAGRISDEHHLTLEFIRQLGLSTKLSKASTDVVFAPADGSDSAYGSVLDAPNSPFEEGIFTRLLLNSISASTTSIKHAMDAALGGITIPNAALVAQVLLAGKLEPRSSLQNQNFVQFAKKVLTEEQVQFIVDSFGYYSELVAMNAYDALELMNSLGPNHNFYIMSGGGLSQIVSHTEKILKTNKNIRILLNTEVISIEYTIGNSTSTSTQSPTSIPTQPHTPIPTKFAITYHTKSARHTVHANTCICALPKWALEKIPIFRTNHQLIKDIQSVYCGPLCRIYTTFPPSASGKVWFEGLPKMTTDNEIRMIIPIDPAKGTIMITYTDNKYADFWKKLHERKGMRGVNEKIQKLIRQSLGINVPPPQHTKIFYWSCGVGYWKIGVNSKEVSQRMIQPLPHIPLYVCGENYSEKRQQWIEGALETAKQVMEIIL